MTLGRLKAIEGYTARFATSKELVVKCASELIAEVKRLRAVLIAIQECDDITAAGPIMLAADALAEPDLGPPDLIHRSKT